MNLTIFFMGFLILPGLIMLLSSLIILLKWNLHPLFIGCLNTIIFVIEVICSITIWYNAGSNFRLEPFKGFALDWLSLSIISIANLLFVIVSLFSIYYIDKNRLGVYYTMLGGLQLGVNLVLLANHFFLLFVFWELMVISGYILVVFENQAESYEAGFKYLTMSSMGSLFMLLGIALLTSLVPDLSFDSIKKINILDTFTGRLAMSCLIIGFGVTAGFVFLNQWLADAHPAAPAPISSLLSGIIVKLGIYGIYRTQTILLHPLSLNFSSSTIIVIIGIITMTEGNFMVISQFLRNDTIDVKRILAYSTTVHLGYLLLVVGFNSELGKIEEAVE